MKKAFLLLIGSLLLSSCSLIDSSSSSAPASSTPQSSQESKPEESSPEASTSEESEPEESSEEPSEESSEETSSSEEISSSEETSLSSEASSVSSSSIASNVFTVQDDTSPLPSKQRSYYQLLVYSFADGNNDGIGDFKGIVDKLDYLQKLGIGGIWLSPIHPAASYHSYDVTDYYSVNSVYTPTVDGVRYDLNKLLSECHSRDIHVILDLVLNHSSTNHPWYYSDHKNWYTSSDQWYFGGSMPEFNYDIPAVRNEMKNIGTYWLNKGVDGFRLDAAWWIYNHGNYATKDDENKTIAWWQEFATAMKNKKSDVYLIGEVLTDDNQNAIDMYAGLDADFNFERIGATVRASKGEEAGKYAEYVASYHKKITAKNSDAIPSPTLSNHDIGRFPKREQVSGAEALKMANALTMITPGGGYLYYGDELGMDASSGGWDDMAYRTPMPWSKGQTNSQSYYGQSSSYTTLTNKKADIDAKSDSSLYGYLAKAINFKNKHIDLYTGTPTQFMTPSGRLGAIKVSGNRDYIIFINSATSAAELTLSGPYGLGCDLATSGHVSLTEDGLHIPKKSIAILEIKDGFKLDNLSWSDGSQDESSSSDGFDFKGTPESKVGRIDSPVSGKMTLYYFNGETLWDDVYCYAWLDGSTNYLGSWPGTKMTKVDDYWYSIEISHGASNVIFANGQGEQTIDLAENNGTHYFVPTSFDGKINGDWYSSNPLG